MLDETVLISVIVPVYNSEKYLAECIDSILKQSYSNIEILLINDGSSDGSEIVCQSYANRDERVKYFCQTNQGVSSARNSGINNASGNYLMFIDSDDTISETAVEELFKNCIKNQAQIAVGGIVRVREGKKLRMDFDDCVYKGSDEIAEMLAEFYITSVASSPCCKLYSRDVIADIRFREGVALGEDLLFNINIFSSANKVVLVNEELYYYRLENSSSLTNIYKDGYYEDMRLIYEEATEFFVRIEGNSHRTINKSNIGYKFYNYAVAFIVRQIERGDSKKSCKMYIDKICDDQIFIEAINLINAKSLIDNIMISWLKKKRTSLLYNVAFIRSKVRRL